MCKKRKSKFQKKCLTIGIILIFTSTTIGCAGYTKYAYTKGDKITLGAMIVAKAADVGTTIYALDNGFRETNPFYGDDPSPATLIISQAIITGLIVWAAQYVNSDNKKVLLGVPALFHGVAAAHNYKLILED